MRFNLLWHLLFGSVLAWSAWKPYDRATWLLEVFPALVAYGVIVGTKKKYPFTPLVYLFILLHSVVLMVGGKYTYARVPFFKELSGLWGSQRNCYDGLGHLLQGFVPALIAREIFIREKIVSSKYWRGFIIVCVCLAISAAYELVEWAVAVAMEQGASEFLGTQGDPWDTQKDMLCALVGALAAVCFVGRVQDRQLLERSRRVGQSSGEWPAI